MVEDDVDICCLIGPAGLHPDGRSVENRMRNVKAYMNGAGRHRHKLIEFDLRWHVEWADRPLELQTQTQIFGFDGRVLEPIERDMRVAPVGSENDGAEDIASILDRKEARRGIIVVIMQTSQTHCHNAGHGFPVGQERSSLVPEIADINRTQREVGMEKCRADNVVPVAGITGECLDL